MRVIYAETRSAVAKGCLSENEARTKAIAAYREHLGSSRGGQRILERLNHEVTWPLIRRFFLILPEVGVWLSTRGGTSLPEGIADYDDREAPLLFVLIGGAEHLGTYDEIDDVFIATTGHRFAPAKVESYLIIPPRNP